jgi:hypothetical protein
MMKAEAYLKEHETSARTPLALPTDAAPAA